MSKHIIKDGRDHCLHIGSYWIAETKKGKIWIGNYCGEGMATTKNKFEAMLRKFFEKEF